MRIALAGDTMLGRGVAETLEADPRALLFDPPVAEICREADFCVLNLECCISNRGERGAYPHKLFLFRAPAVAVDVLTGLGVDCVNLANNHALDFGCDALLDTFEHLRSAGIQWVGAGRDVNAARAPTALKKGASRLVVLGASDHVADFAAGPAQPGIALAELGGKVSPWLLAAIKDHRHDPVLVSPHWGPNMNPEPLRRIRAAADALVAAGAALVAGHSAHLFHGVKPPILYDLGDFIDDYAVDPRLRNDLGLLFVVTLTSGRITQIEAVPLRLDYCHTRLAAGNDAEWIGRRFSLACEKLGTSVESDQDRLIIQV
jgi:poly-gamma-glutamate capsule biosynthesis protein CapA/YwtB (metallophosphatase superfamily)